MAVLCKCRSSTAPPDCIVSCCAAAGHIVFRPIGCFGVSGLLLLMFARSGLEELENMMLLGLCIWTFTLYLSMPVDSAASHCCMFLFSKYIISLFLESLRP